MKRTKITDYTPDPANPNRHTERGVAMLEDSLHKVGLGRSIVVDRNGIVLAGNSTQERAVDQGFEDAIEVETDGTRLVVVKRTDLDLLDDETKARLLSYYDNRAAQTGIEFDPERILADLNAGIDFKGLFFDWELEKFQIAPDAEQDYAAQWAGMPAYEQEGVEGFHKLTLHFATEQDMATFATLIGQPISPKTTYLWIPAQVKEDLLAYVAHDES